MKRDCVSRRYVWCVGIEEYITSIAMFWDITLCSDSELLTVRERHPTDFSGLGATVLLNTKYDAA